MLMPQPGSFSDRDGKRNFPGYLSLDYGNVLYR